MSARKVHGRTSPGQPHHDEARPQSPMPRQLLPVQRQSVEDLGEHFSFTHSQSSRDSANASPRPARISTHLPREMTLNQARMLGRVPENPRIEGTLEYQMVSFNLITESYAISEGVQSIRSDWHRICIFQPSLIGRVLNLLRAGDRAFVTGEVTHTILNSYDTPRTSIRADDVVIYPSPRLDDDEDNQDDAL